jgi:hypothetical protein
VDERLCSPQGLNQHLPDPLPLRLHPLHAHHGTRHNTPPHPTTQAWPQQRLAAEGVALFGLAAAPDGGGAAGAGLRDVVLRFFRPGQPLPFHCFSQV